jgi:hypothetical protein
MIRNKKCFQCNRHFTRNANLMLHLRKCQTTTAFNNNVRCTRTSLRKKGSIDPTIQLARCARQAIKTVRNSFLQYGTLKVMLAIAVVFHQLVGNEIIETNPAIIFNAHHAEKVLTKRDVKRVVQGMIGGFERKIEDFQSNGSGYVFAKIKELIISTVRFRPFKGGANFLPVPQTLVYRQALVNVKGNDNKCFKRSVLAALYSHKFKRNKHLASKYQGFEHKLNFANVKFPISTNLKKTTKSSKLMSLGMIINPKSCSQGE